MKVDYHVYPSEKKVIKAFTANNFAFYDKSGNLIIPLGDKSADIVKKLRLLGEFKRTVETVRQLHYHPMMTIPRSVPSVQC